jgi:hypothetical protein
MKGEIQLGKLAGLNLSARWSAVIALAGLWVVLSVVGVTLLGLTAGQAILGGLVGVGLHWASLLVHHLGHAWVARRTGYPMVGVRFWVLFGTSLYPENEPELPAKIHIRRALGGPFTSFMLTGLGAVLFLLFLPRGGLLVWLAAFFFLENMFLFTLGALLPLGFTDGSTLLAWR